MLQKLSILHYTVNSYVVNYKIIVKLVTLTGDPGCADTSTTYKIKFPKLKLF